MGTLITPEKDSHWYTPSGEPRYDATLREARKENLYPSVTAITKMWPKHMLESWKQEQCVLSALTLPRLPGEADDAFAKRVVIDAQAHTKATADWGTRIHKQCELIHRGEPTTELNGIAPWIEEYRLWWAKQAWKLLHCEKPVIHKKYGYGGKLDICVDAAGMTSVADVKTRSVKDSKPAFYPEQAMQLAAYAFCLGVRDFRLFSVIINRDKPEQPYVKWWTAEEVVDAWLNFLACLDLWKRVNRYDPTNPQ